MYFSCFSSCFFVTVMYPTDHSESSGLSGAEWEENSLQEASHHGESPYSPPINSFGIPWDSTCGTQQEENLSSAARREQLQRGQNYKELDDKEEGEKERISFSNIL